MDDDERPAFTVSQEMLTTNPVDLVSQLQLTDAGGVYGQAARIGAAIHNILHPDNPVKTVREWEADDDLARSE